MRALVVVLVASCLALPACDQEANAVKQAMSNGTSCPASKVEVKEVTRQYPAKQLSGNVSIFQANVCGGGWRTVCLQRGTNEVSEGLDRCLMENTAP